MASCTCTRSWGRARALRGALVAAVNCRGHAGDGSAFIVIERGLLLPGDYLSAVCHPIVLDSVSGALAAIERLLVAIEEHEIETIVPGHGPVLRRQEAVRIGRQDMTARCALAEAAHEAYADVRAPATT
jgi:glyoxylase-like metal-dependent hydrolase (beta-lactamase superfamily II)